MQEKKSESSFAQIKTKVKVVFLGEQSTGKTSILTLEIAFVPQYHGDCFFLLAVEAEIDPFVEIIEGAPVWVRKRYL